MKRRISHGQAIRSVFGRSRVTHRIGHTLSLGQCARDRRADLRAAVAAPLGVDRDFDDADPTSARGPLDGRQEILAPQDTLVTDSRGGAHRTEAVSYTHLRA